jgi:hypothetical protein
MKQATTVVRPMALPPSMSKSKAFLRRAPGVVPARAIRCPATVSRRLRPKRVPAPSAALGLPHPGRARRARARAARSSEKRRRRRGSPRRPSLAGRQMLTKISPPTSACSSRRPGEPRFRLHLQRPEVPSSGEPQSAAHEIGVLARFRQP